MLEIAVLAESEQSTGAAVWAAADGTVAQIRAELNAYGKSAYARPV